jgi:hypothetical protein
LDWAGIARMHFPAGKKLGANAWSDEQRFIVLGLSTFYSSKRENCTVYT